MDSIVSWSQVILQYAKLRFIGMPIEVCLTVEFGLCIEHTLEASTFLDQTLVTGIGL